MKYIQKGKEPASLTAWKKVQKINGLIPEYGDLRGKEKKDLHDSLLADQGYICCYCGVQVSQENSHIEHLPSQAYFRLNNDPNGTTDYQHLLASCGISEQWRKDKYEKEWTEKKFEELTSSSDRCGIKRGNQPVAISPLQADCEAFFAYDASMEQFAQKKTLIDRKLLQQPLHYSISTLKNLETSEKLRLIAPFWKYLQ